MLDDPLNLAHVARKNVKKKLKQTNTSAHIVGSGCLDPA